VKDGNIIRHTLSSYSYSQYLVEIDEQLTVVMSELGAPQQRTGYYNSYTPRFRVEDFDRSQQYYKLRLVNEHGNYKEIT
jgi:hypothetical protein